MRLFIAINFDNKTKQNILAVQKRLKELGRGTFTRPGNLHLTLAFLGEVPEERVDALKLLMDGLEIPMLNLNFNNTGCFRSDLELWWIGIEYNKALSDLQRELIKRLKEAGFKPDDKRFKPHITLARRMHIGHVDTKTLLPVEFKTSVNSISLMLSHQVEGKLTYTELYHV